MEITIKLANLTQLEALAAALETYIDLENERTGDGPTEFTANDKARLTSARQVFAMVTGGKVRS